MNSINICGRMTKDPELRRTNSQKAVCSFSLAVKRPYSAEETDFIECVVWQQGAEYLTKYGHKGDLVAITGSLQSRKWTDKDGNNRTAWEVVADNVELVSSNRNDQQTPAAQPSYPAYPQQPTDPQYPQQPMYPQQNFEVLNDPNIQLPF